MADLTDWYPMTVYPVRVGWYDVTVGWPGNQEITRGYWNGNVFAVRREHLALSVVCFPQRWRGLAHDTSKVTHMARHEAHSLG